MNAVTLCQRLSKLGVLSAIVLAGAHWRGTPAAAAGAPQAVKTEADRAAYMRMHYGQVLTLYEAVIRGDLAAVAPVARQLAEQDPPASVQSGSAALVAEMRRAARRAVDAETILAAAIATASMLKTCGGCHRSAGTMPALPPLPRPELGGVVGHMLEHQRAADQMAQGLIVPSSTAWRAGAEGFRGAPLHPKALPGGVKLPSQVLASEERIHQLASQAVRAEDPGARAMFYGQILARCADCHAQHKTLWGPAGR
jgi:hypothetical protein